MNSVDSVFSQLNYPLKDFSVAHPGEDSVWKIAGIASSGFVQFFSVSCENRNFNTRWEFQCFPGEFGKGLLISACHENNKLVTCRVLTDKIQSFFSTGYLCQNWRGAVLPASTGALQKVLQHSVLVNCVVVIKAADKQDISYF